MPISCATLSAVTFARPRLGAFPPLHQGDDALPCFKPSEMAPRKLAADLLATSRVALFRSSRKKAAAAGSTRASGDHRQKLEHGVALLCTPFKARAERRSRRSNRRLRHTHVMRACAQSTQTRPVRAAWLSRAWPTLSLHPSECASGVGAHAAQEPK